MKFNGIDPTTLHAGISVAKEVPPGSVTSQLETLGGSTGEIIVGRTIQQGEYIVRVNIAGKSKAQAWEIRKLLAGWACAADSVTHRLIPTHWPDVYYEAILKEITPPEFVFGFATIDVIFAIPRPIACDVDMTTELGSFGTTSTFEIGGTAHARPVISVSTLAAENLEVYVDDVLLARIKGPFAEKDSINISTEYNVVAVSRTGDTESNVYCNELIDYTVTDFEQLAQAFKPGSRTVYCPSAKIITLNWRNEWL